jgi:predicted acyltransferase
MDPSSNHSTANVLGYGRATAIGKSPRRVLPRTFVFASIMPILMFAVVVSSPNRWFRWFHIGQERERIVGVLWMMTAAWSLACLLVLSLFRKRWDIYAGLLVHGLMIAFTIFPGHIAIRFLMHWLPPGPGT